MVGQEAVMEEVTIEVSGSESDLRYIADQLLTQGAFHGCRFANIANTILEQIPVRGAERFWYEEINASVIGRKLVRWKCGPWVAVPHKDDEPREIKEVRLDGAYVRVYQGVHVDLFVAPGGWIEVEL